MALTLHRDDLLWVLLAAFPSVQVPVVAAMACTATFLLDPAAALERHSPWHLKMQILDFSAAFLLGFVCGVHPPAPDHVYVNSCHAFACRRRRRCACFTHVQLQVHGTIKQWALRDSRSHLIAFNRPSKRRSATVWARGLCGPEATRPVAQERSADAKFLCAGAGAVGGVSRLKKSHLFPPGHS